MTDRLTAAQLYLIRGRANLTHTPKALLHHTIEVLRADSLALLADLAAAERENTAPKEQIGAGLTEHSKQAMIDIAAEQAEEKAALKDLLQTALLHPQIPRNMGKAWCDEARALLGSAPADSADPVEGGQPC
jgi:hypothetical protein